jgi:ABC-type branched-subunit amino acid transport system substrate-binding protein
VRLGVRVVRRSSRRRRPFVLLLAVGLAALPACGLRVNQQTLRAANRAAMGSGSGGGGGGLAAGDSGGGTDTGTTLAASGATGGPGGAAGPAGAAQVASGGVATTVAGVATAGGVETGVLAPPAPAGGNGGATDVGVSGDTITVGNVSDLGGPVPGLFQGGPYGTQAYFDYINSMGGVYGRKLKLVSADDQLQCNQNEAAYQNMVGQVFGFVGSWSLDDSCGAQILAQHPTVPAVQQALSTQFTNLPNSYSISPYNAGAPTGYFQYFKQKFPDAITSVGTLVGNQAAAVQSWNYYKATMQTLGYKVVYEDDFPPAQSNFTADVIRMRSAGVKMVFIIAVNAPDLAAFSQEAAQQGWKPEVFVAPIGYFGSYVSESGGAAAVEGQYVPVVQAMFLGEDATSVPEVGLFDHWIKQDFPSFPIDQFSSTSWAQAALFVQALDRVGPHLTRQGLLAALAQIHDFNDFGMMAPADVASKQSGHCYLILQIHNGKYQKVDDPASGYRCDGTFYKVS